MSGRIYGYARVSTMKQKVERQIENLKAVYPEATIIAESYTGTKMNRPQWNCLIKKIKEGDTIVFDEVSRMSRNAEEGIEVYKELYNKGVNLIFIKESTLNTDNFREAQKSQIPLTGNDEDLIFEGINNYLMKLAENQIRTAFESAEKEVNFLRQRIREGIQHKEATTDWKSGNKPGAKLTTKKSIESKEVILKHSKDFGGTLNDIELMKMTNLSRNTFYKYKKELKAEYEDILAL